jgi:hypothetical protein
MRTVGFSSLVAVVLAGSCQSIQPENAAELKPGTVTKTTRLPIMADASLRKFLPNGAHGADVRLHLGRNGLNTDRTVLRADTATIRAEIGRRRLMTAELELAVESQSPTWTAGARVAAHPLRGEWREASATWNCRNDTMTDNFLVDCAAADLWTFEGNLPPYAQPPTGSAAVGARAVGGVIRIDVTADVQRWLSQDDNRGWALNLTGDAVTDWINFHSRTSGRPPALLITTANPCTSRTGCGTPVAWEGPGGTEMPVLAQPIDGPTTWSLHSNFDWGSTRPVAETTPDGHPTVRYALFYIESKEQLPALDVLQVEWSSLPMFAEERRRWAGQRGIIANQGDGSGVFVYGIVFGRLYNVMRAAALEGNPAFSAIILRTPPAGVPTYPDGSIHYDVFREEGFQWGERAKNRVLTRPVTPGLQAFGLVDRVRGWVEDGAEIAGDVVDGFREGVGAVREFINGSCDVEMMVLAKNIDDSFVSDVQRRGWGKDRGALLGLEGVNVRLSQGRFGVALSEARSDRWGFVRIVAEKDARADICIELENSAILTTAHVVPAQACDFSDNTISAGDMHGTVQRWIEVNQGMAAAFSAMTDGYHYADSVLGRQMHQARFVVGTLADAVMGAIGLVSDSDGLAPCLGLSPEGFTRLAGALADIAAGGAIDLTGAPGLTASLAASAGATLFGAAVVGPDILLNGKARRNRGIPVHEYGHFVMCSLMHSANASQMSQAYIDVIVDRVFSSEDPDHQAGFLAEGWADFVAGQVVGGTLYFAPHQSFDDRPDETSYCPAGEEDCLDDNAGGSPDSPFPPNQMPTGSVHKRIARTATLLHDMVDGNSNVMNQDVPGNGAAWLSGGKNDAGVFQLIDAGAIATADPSLYAESHESDEQVALSGPTVGRLFEKWAAQPGQRLDEKSLYLAMTQLMKDSGVTDAQICELFALHQPTHTCPSWLPVSQNLTPGPVLGLDSHLFSTDPETPDTLGRNARWSWTADAPFATNFVLNLRNRTAGTVILSQTLPYQRDVAVNFDRMSVPFNIEMELGVVTANANGNRRSAEMISILATTAEPVGAPTVLTTVGRTKICFTETQASFYALEVQDGPDDFDLLRRFSDQTGNAQNCHELFGLPATPHTIRVVAHNRHNRPGAPSPLVTFTPRAPALIYVSGTMGNDMSTTPSNPSTPFRTLGRALSYVSSERARTITLPGSPITGPIVIRNDAMDGVRIHLEEGSYTMTTAWREADARFMTELLGGLQVGTWQRTARQSDILGVTQLTPAGTGCTDDRVSTLFSADNGGALLLSNVTASVPAIVTPGTGRPDNGPGLAAVAHAARGGALVIDDSRFFVDGVPGTARTSAPISASGRQTRVQLKESFISSRTGSATALGGSLVGVCVRDLGQLEINESMISSTNANLTAATTGPQTAAPVMAIGVSDLLIIRSQLIVAPFSPAYRPTTTTQSALLASGIGSLLMHNSVLRTATGGSTNIVASLEAPHGNIEILQSTLVAGYDFPFTTTGRFASAAVLRLTGASATVNLANNIFGWAGGRANLVVLLDRAAQTADTRRSVVRNNIFSLPSAFVTRPFFMRCGSDMQGGSNEINDPLQHACFRSSFISFDVSGNQANDSRGCESAPDPAACFAKLGDAWGAILETKAVTITDIGASVPDNRATVHCLGNNLRWYDRRSEVWRDIGSVSRREGRPGLDDNCDGTIDEPDERPDKYGVGAFAGVCGCLGRDPHLL